MHALSSFFGAAGFLPHGYCILWRPDILALHVTSDLVIAAAYFSIPMAILSFARRRTDLLAEHRLIALLFCVFILGCGATHLMGVVVLWRPYYGLDGLIKAFTALASIVTAALLWPMVPRLLQIPSAGALTLANERLQAEVSAKLAALDQLGAIRASLEAEVDRRTRQVQALARRFEIATEGSLITVTEQDENLRYTWVHNPQRLPTSAFMGRSDDELLEPESADVLTPLKRRVLESDEAWRGDVAVGSTDQMRHYSLKITPAELEGGGRGLLVASVDISERKRQEEHLGTLMRELAHRAKNLLSMVDGLARQTARAEGLPDSFVARFAERLAALAAAHDLLVGHEWEGASLDELARSQIAHVLPGAGARIMIEGPDLILQPEAAQYLALALHELATNATKHGVLGRDSGTVAISWTIEQVAGRRRIALSWRERGQAVATPTRTGFGRRLLEELVPRAVRGEAALEFGDSGLLWRIDFEG